MSQVLAQLLGRPPRGLLFDLDGTLLDSVPDLTAAVDAMLAAANLPLAGEPRVRTWVGNGAKVLVEKALAFALHCRPQEISLEQLAAHHQQFLKFYGQCSGQHSELYDGVLPALDILHRQGLNMAVVTNKPAEFIDHLLRQFKLHHYFSVCVGGNTLAQRKPSPEPLQYACQQLGLGLGECIMIGDSETDVAAARAANMPVACVSYGYNHGEPVANAKPDLVVDSLLELSA